MVATTEARGGLMPEDVEDLSRSLARIEERVLANTALMEAKFVTFRVLLDSNAEKVAIALAASDKAITKAEGSDNKRFDLLNELRSDVATHAEVTAIEKQLEDLKERLDRMEGSTAGNHGRLTDQRASIAAIVGVSTLLLAVVIFVANIVTSRP